MPRTYTLAKISKDFPIGSGIASPGGIGWLRVYYWPPRPIKVTVP